MSDPFVNVHSNASAIIWVLARKLNTEVAHYAIWLGRGWDPKSTEHATGRALDIMVSAKVNTRPTDTQKLRGDRLAAYLVKHAKTMHIRHIIWNERIYRTRYGAWGPLPLTATRSTNYAYGHSDWHRDHLHVWLEDTAGSIPTETIVLDGSTAPAPAPSPSPGLPSTGADGWDGKSFPGASVFKNGVKHPATLLLQQRLKAHGHNTGALDGHFGPNTSAAVEAFQYKQGWTGSDADGIPGPTTWTRLMAAVATKPTVSLSKLAAAFKADPPKFGTPVSYAPTLIVEAALVREGLLGAKYSDGHAGTATRTAFSAWQKRLGYRGADADGLPGSASLAKLAAKHGFTVTA